ncbi:MAG: DNA primase [Puniceicoccales bacterium]|nr:DNA primase [Puniceicoccales bacterium]
MARITRQCVDDVRSRADFVALVNDYTALKKSGASWKGLSPFTSEKTPSFYVHPHKEMCWCFSTGQGGDIFRFIMLKEGLNFQEAVERVASRFGIEVKYEDTPGGESRDTRSLRAQLLTLHEVAVAHYAAAFFAKDAAAAQVREYWLTQRKFTAEVAEQFQIGFAPVADSGGLIRLLNKRGFTKNALAQSGLFTGVDYTPDPLRWHARFRGRLMIPIRDAQGRTVAFTARVLPFLPPDEKDPTRDAKYVNSPETEIFKKSQILFNLDKARAAARAGDTPVVLVEGQLDAIRAYTCGVTTAVAGQGTAIGHAHFMLLRRFTRRVDILLDSDRAGQDAMLKILPLALAAEIEARILHVPGGKDPDEYFADAGAEGWPAVRDSVSDATEFAAKALLPKGATAHSTAERMDALQKLFAIVAEAKSAVLRSEMLEKIVRLTLFDRRGVERDFEVFLRTFRSRANAGTSGADGAGGAGGAGGGAAGGSGGAAASSGGGGGAAKAAQGGSAVASGGSGAVAGGAAGQTGGNAPARGNGAYGAARQVAPSQPLSTVPLNSVEETLLVLALNHDTLPQVLAPQLEHEWLDASSAAGRLLNRVLAEAQEEQWRGKAMIHELPETEAEQNLVARLLVGPEGGGDDNDGGSENGGDSGGAGGGSGKVSGGAGGGGSAGVGAETPRRKNAPEPPWWKIDPLGRVNECLAKIFERQIVGVSERLLALPDGAWEERMELVRERAELRRRRECAKTAVFEQFALAKLA